MPVSDLFLLISLGYASVLLIGGWLTASPVQRERLRLFVQSAAGRTLKRCGQTLVMPFHRATAASVRSARFAVAGMKVLIRDRRRLGTAVLLLSLPPVVTGLLAGRAALDAYRERPEAPDQVIAALLRGEHLVTPPAPPPAAFAAREVTVVRRDAADADRHWARLNPDFRRRLLALYSLMQAHGYRMVLIEGYRSPERQAQLARLGPQVTNAGAYQSYHQYGLAADSAFFRDGKVVVSGHDPWAAEGYRLYGRLASSVGLTWGGNWRMRDLGHVELKRPDVLAAR